MFTSTTFAKTVVDGDVSGHALDAALAAARRALGVMEHRPGGIVLPRKIRGREPIPVRDEVEGPLAGSGTDGAPLRSRRIEVRVAGRDASHLPVVRRVARARRRPALRYATDVWVALRRGAVQVVHRGCLLARAPRAPQRHDVAQAVPGAEAPRAQPADIVVLIGPYRGSHVHGVGDGHGDLGECRREPALAFVAGAAGPEHPVYVSGPPVSRPERQQAAGLQLCEFDPPRSMPYRAHRCPDRRPRTRKRAPRYLAFVSSSLAQAAPLDRYQVVRVLRQRIGQIVPSGRDLLPDRLGVHEGIAPHRTVVSPGLEEGFVAEVFGEEALDACRGVVLLDARLPVPIAMADETMADGENILVRRLERRVGVERRLVDCSEHALARSGGEKTLIDGA